MVLTYHEIVSSECSYIYSIAREVFVEHLAVVAAVAAGGRPAITFDDGHASHYEHAVPALDAVGCRATFFVTTDWIGARRGYMTWSEVRQAAEMGHSVQSHGCSHRFLTQCSAAELDRELRKSKAEIEDRLGREVDAISAPQGAWNQRVIEGCAAAGYRRLFVSDPWITPTERSGITLVGRWMVRRNTTAREIAQLMDDHRRGESKWWISQRIKRAVRTVIGESLYLRLWAIGAHLEEPDGILRDYQSTAANGERGG